MAQAKKTTTISANRFILSIVAICMVSIGLLVGRIVASDSTRYVFLIWNLALAILAPLIAWWLVQRIHSYGWLKWQQIAITILFLGFLPNSFYLFTDFVHIRDTYEISLIYDVVMMAGFMLSGLVLGYTAVYLVHRELKRRFSENDSLALVGLILLAASFAIYLGRYTRFNTWDLLLQPAGLLFDVSDRFVNPAVHTDTFVTTGTIFLLLTSLYLVIYEAIRLFTLEK